MKKRISLLIPGLIIAVLLTALCLTGCLDKAANAETLEFEADDSVVIAQITDTHYFPLNYCYNGSVDETDYEDALITGMKLVLESSFINVQAIKEIVDENPDYLVVTGDMTHNGEIQAHIELANLLRQLQNRVRAKGNSDFQVFVTPGNHDMYNKEAVYFRDNGEEKFCNQLTTRYDITKIYSSLGYPDLTDQEITDYYATLTDVYYDDLPYQGPFINSTTASNVRIEYQYKDNNNEDVTDYDNGDLTYVAFCPNDYVFIAVDEEISDEEVFHHVGGIMYKNSKTYLNSKKSAGKFTGKTLIGMMHHNAVPHFEGEDTLLKDFTLYGWKDSTDYFADLGMHFMFTGHMHSNDIATHSSFNGNVLTDIETASMIGYKGGTRYCKIERGTVGDEYSENFSSRIALVGPTDFTSAFDKGYMSDYYLEYCNLEKFIDKSNGKHICTDPSEYAVTKLFYNIVDNVKHQYLDVDFLANAGSFVAGLLPETDNDILKNVFEIAEPLVNALIRHIDQVVLKDYQYQGTNDEYNSNVVGAKLGGFLDDLINNLLDIKVNSEGDNLFDFGLGSYLKHIGGTDTAYNDLSAGQKEAFANFQNGTTIKTMFDMILNKDTGLYKLVAGLTEPIDFTKDLNKEQQIMFKGLLTLLKKKDVSEIKMSAVKLDDTTLISMAGGLLNMNLPYETIMENIDNILNSYITGSFYTSLGEIAHNILYAFAIDPTNKTETSFDGYITYKSDAGMTATYMANAPKEEPSIENGKLPSMVTVTFGDNPETDKNFTWFTDYRVKDTYIEYCEGDFNEDKAKTVKGEFSIYATTTGNIDLGVYATLMRVDTGYHTVELKGLNPGTTYSYRIGSKEYGYWSEVYNFETAPADDEKFELLLMTDIQGSAAATYEQTAEIMAKIEKKFKNYDFIINCGDVVDNSRNLVQWEYFLDILQPYMANSTQVVATGNHERYNYEKLESGEIEYSLLFGDTLIDDYNYYLLHYNIDYPTQNNTTGAYYSFDYSAVHFTVLNTNDIEDNNLSEKQLSWLLDDLKNTDKKFKVVVMHKGIYTSGAHSKDTDVVNMRQQLTSVFADNDVCLVLQGHDHTYSETYYLDRNGKALGKNTDGKITGEGTLYVTLGTLGDKFYDYVENDKVPVEYGQSLHDPALSNPTFGRLVYDGNNLYYYGYQYDLDSGNITKLKGMLWWHYLIIAIISAAVLAGIVIGVVTIVKHNRRKKAVQ